jgi:hypothetical protein
MTQLKLAAYVHDHLRQQGIDLVFSGGSVVSFYSRNLYVSKDIDLANVAFTRQAKLRRRLYPLYPRYLANVMDFIGPLF